MSLNKAQATALLWQKGHVAWKLDPTQQDLYNSFMNATAKTVVWACSRRLGKSFCLSVVAIEQCLRKPNSVVKFIAPTQKHVKMIIRPLLKEIFNDCPKELRPDFRTADNIYRFKNGSEIQLAGTDSGHAEALRGGSSDLCIVDEAGFCDDLRYIVQSILIPTTTTTSGKIILSSTPPLSPDHDFEEYRKEAEFKGNYVLKTIYDNPRLTEAQIQEVIDELGGVDSPEFQREYLCKVIVSEDHAIVPEFSNEELQKVIVREWTAPPFRDLYVGGDIGFTDLTVFLFGYYDFKHNKLIIEDELVMSGHKMTTAYMAEQIKLKEQTLWTNSMTGEQQKPYLRVVDNNLIVINDLHKLHNIDFIPTLKDDAMAALNQVRIKIREQAIIINPKCKTLIFHLKNGVWNKSRKSFNRSPDAGHYDAIDALKYMVRNIQYSKNPYPFGYGGEYGENTFRIKDTPAISPVAKSFENVFNLRKGLNRRINK